MEKSSNPINAGTGHAMTAGSGAGSPCAGVGERRWRLLRSEQVCRVTREAGGIFGMNRSPPRDSPVGVICYRLCQKHSEWGIYFRSEAADNRANCIMDATDPYALHAMLQQQAIKTWIWPGQVSFHIVSWLPWLSIRRCSGQWSGRCCCSGYRSCH